MKVTIIGAGNMGLAIGTRLVAGGHDVSIVDRDPQEAKRVADELRQGGRGTASAAVQGEVGGDVVVLAVYYPGNKEIVANLGQKLANKIVVDIANPIDMNTFEPATAPGTSSAEEVAAQAPAGAKVVKAFNTTFADTLVAGEVAGQQLDVLMAGDDEEAKRTLAQLVRDGGLNPVDAGPLKRAQQLEGVGYLHISLQSSLNTGYQSAVKF